MKTKKILYMTLALLMSASMGTIAACGGGDSSSEKDSSSSLTDSSSSVEEPQEEPLVPVFEETSIKLADNGVTSYKIVISDQASAAEEYAANELATYLGRATGATFPIVKDNTVSSATSQDYILSVGRNDLLTASGITVDRNEVTRDGYRIVRKDNTVYICGGYDTGTAFGVYEFMNHQVGYEAYTAEEIYYDDSPVVYVRDFDYTDIPDFADRLIDGLYWADANTAYKHRIVNDRESVARYGYGCGADWIPSSGHTLKIIVPEDKYKEAHPEWFLATPNAPSSNPAWAQPCYTSESFITTFIENMKERILAKTDGYIVNIAQEDGTTWCPCSTCDGERKQYTTTGYMLRFVNKIVTELEKWHQEVCPERKLIYATFSYGNTTDAPLNDDGQLIDESCRPHEKLWIRKATSGMCGYHTLDNPTCTQNRKIVNSMENWLTLTDQYIWWDYAASYSNYLTFFPDFGSIQSFFRAYKEWGVNNLFREYNSGGNVTPFGYLRGYMYSKFMWNTEHDAETLMDNFITHYYKDVAPQMRALLNLLRTHYAVMDATFDGGMHALPATDLDVRKWPKRIVDQAESICNDALDVIARMEDRTTAAKLRERVLTERLCIYYLKVSNYDNYGYDSADYASFVAQYISDGNEIGITRISEKVSWASHIATLG
ncbi:MAG: DUF4838 domain-containing protein [Clostridia bacterium]|nr:DUF4838 domain-containing protein [Clostridia bacterium]